MTPAPESRERPCAPAPVPAPIADALAGYAWARDTVGESGGTVCRLHAKPGAPDLYLKTGTGPVADDITDEMVRLRWLAGFTRVPAIICFMRTPDAAWLLVTALPGRTAYQLLEADPAGRPAIVDALADFLRGLHMIPADRCPFNSDHRLRLSHARARIDAGLVETDDFDEDRQGWSAEQVWQALERHRPPAADPVITHGDFSLDNIMLEGGAVVGCIDVGRAGLADRYQDLAILWNCLGEFDQSLQRRLFDRYGIAAPDPAMLDFHLMLDELF